MKETLHTRHRNTVESMMVEMVRKDTLQALHTDAVNKAGKGHEMNVVLDGRPPPISNSEKDLTRKERSTNIRILWTPELLQELNQEGCKPQRLCRLRHDEPCCQASFRLPGPPDYNDTVRFMEQTGGRCPGTQISRGERPTHYFRQLYYCQSKILFCSKYQNFKKHQSLYLFKQHNCK